MSTGRRVSWEELLNRKEGRKEGKEKDWIEEIEREETLRKTKESGWKFQQLVALLSLTAKPNGRLFAKIKGFSAISS